jgi:hypothetical protein
MLEKSINKYNILQMSYENIFHVVSNNIDFVFHMLILLCENLVKLYIVWLFIGIAVVIELWTNGGRAIRRHLFSKIVKIIFQKLTI